MVTAGDDGNPRLHYFANQPMLLIDTPRPTATELMAQRCRLSRSVIGVSDNLFEETVDPLQHLFIVLLPIEIVFPGTEAPNQFHPPPLSKSYRDFSIVSPDSNSRSDLNRCSRLAGERSR
jgi:hypothetical protein